MARIIDESFEGTGYEETWTEYTAGTVTVDQDSAGPGSLPSGGGSECLRVNIGSGGAGYARRDYGSAVAIAYARAYVYIDSYTLADNTALEQILSLIGDGQTYPTFGVRLLTVGSQLSLHPQYHTTSWVSMTAASINVDTWYRVEVLLDTTNGVCEWRLNGTQIQRVTGLTFSRGPMRYLRLGTPYGTSGRLADMYFDLAAVDNADWVGEESSGTPLSGSATLTMECAAADVAVPMALSGAASVTATCSSADISFEGALTGAASLTLTCGAADVAVPMALSGAASVGMTCSSATISGVGAVARKAVFIHHSTGGALIADANGGLASDLNDAGYFFSDICYQWDAPSNTDIGSLTDIGDWYDWLVDTTDQGGTPKRDRIMGAVYTEYDKDAYSVATYGDYTRTVTDPGGENEIIVLKSCYPNSNIYDDNDTVLTDLNSHDVYYTVGGQSPYTLSNCKAMYNAMLTYMQAHTDKLFILMTPPPLLEASTTSARAANARALNDWLMDEWLQDASWTGKNVRVFDSFTVLTDPDNHHRVETGVEVHHTEVDSSNYIYYTAYGNNHPTQAGNLKWASEFAGLLDLWLAEFDAWDESLAGSATVTMTCSAADISVPMALSGAASISMACSDATIVDMSSDDLSGSASVTMSCGAADVSMPIALVGEADGSTWAEVGSNALPVATRNHALLDYDDKLWVIGGDTTAPTRKVYWSADQGATWTEAGTDALPVALSTPASCVFAGRMWVLGGYTGAALSLKVYWSTDGASWTEAGADALPVGSTGNKCVAHDGKMWLIAAGSSYSRKVYSSPDGAAWTESGTDALPIPLWQPEVAVHDGKMWVIGGYTTGGVVVRKVYSSEDGETWTEVGTDSFPVSIASHAVATYAGKLWVVGGASAGAVLRTVYSSADGATWAESGAAALPEGRMWHRVVVHRSKLVVVGGYSAAYANVRTVYYARPVVPFVMQASGEASVALALSGAASMAMVCADAETAVAMALTGAAQASVAATGTVAIAFAVSGGAVFVLVCSSAFLDTGAFEEGVERVWRFRAQTGAWVFT